MFLALSESMRANQNNHYVPVLGTDDEQLAVRLVERGGYMIANFFGRIFRETRSCQARSAFT